jgi:hypothetical protein
MSANHRAITPNPHTNLLNVCVCVCVYIYIYIHTYKLQIKRGFNNNKKCDQYAHDVSCSGTCDGHTEITGDLCLNACKFRKLHIDGN